MIAAFISIGLGVYEELRGDTTTGNEVQCDTGGNASTPNANISIVPTEIPTTSSTTGTATTEKPKDEDKYIPPWLEGVAILVAVSDSIVHQSTSVF